MYLVLPEDPAAHEIEAAVADLGVFDTMPAAVAKAFELAGDNRAHVVHKVTPIAFYRARGGTNA